MGFFENEREFRKRAEGQKLPTACQAAFYVIIGKFNDAGWAEEIDLSDSELMRLTQIRSSKTIADVKSRLKLSGIIDFRTSKYYGTTYKLVQLASTAWSEQQGKAHSKVQTKVQSKVQSEAPFVKYTLNESTEEDGKTVRLEDGGGGARASASVYTGESAGKATAPTSPRQNPSGKPAEFAGSKNIEVSQKKYCSEELEQIWIMHSGQQPNEGICMKLGYLEQTYGLERVKAAIEEANYRNQGGCININFVQSVLMRMLRGGAKVGTEQNNGGNERTATNYYDEGFFV